MHIRDYIEHLKSKPEHIRRRIALGTSAGFTGVVALAWLVALSTSGTLALTSPEEIQNAAEMKAVVQETSSSFSDLMGAASAFQSASQNSEELIIVDAESSSTLDAPADTTEGKTVIPF